MALSISLSEADATVIGRENLEKLIKSYSSSYPTYDFLADVALISEDAMRDLNRAERNIDEATDVLSFPTLKNPLAEHKGKPVLIGGIVICPTKATNYGETLPQLVHHGLLHLLGFDHETNFELWRHEEERILAVLRAHQLDIPAVPYDTV